jgi:type IV pilus assembly protein PilP
MKFLPLFLSMVFLLSGCIGDRSDLELFVTTTKAQHVALTWSTEFGQPS